MLVACGDDNQVNPIPDKYYVNDYDSEVILGWNQFYLEVERYAQFYRPGPGPRSLGYIGLAAYEACATGMRNHNSVRSAFSGLNIPDVDANVKYHWPSVVHGVYHTMMLEFFPNSTPEMKLKWQQLLDNYDAKLKAEAGLTRFNASFAYGEAVGQAVWDWSATENGHNAYLDPFGAYDWQAHYDGPGDWVPTTPGPGKGLFPFMTQWRTFVVGTQDKIAQPPSAYYMNYSSDVHSEYYSQALQVYTKNAAQDYLTEWIGEFWSDDLTGLTFGPGPRWIAVACQVVTKDAIDLETSLEVFAKLGLALNDAVVSCWHSKYLYNVERPETYIRAHIDPNYKTNLTNPLTGEVGLSPSFPAYPSGHATMGAAGAEALASVFGYSYMMTDRCHQGRIQFEGTPRTFGSFYEMAQENAWSRVLLGVHFRMDADEGMRFGTNIGRKVNQLPWK
jgi:membrane-associated phospholipid phosphatase